MSYNDATLGTEAINQRRSARNAMLKAQNRTTHLLLPDNCTIRPDVDAGSYTVNSDGVAISDVPANRTYNSLEAIPCRADDVRSFRPDAFVNQPTQVDEIDLHLPIDFVCLETDIVTLNGFEYKIRKLSDDADWTLTKVAKLTRLGDVLD